MSFRKWAVIICAFFLSIIIGAAIAGVGGTFVRNQFNQLDPAQRADLMAFLNSL